MFELFRRQYSVRKYSRINRRWIDESLPAPKERLFWTRFHAHLMAARLNQGLRWLRYDDKVVFLVIKRFEGSKP